MHQPKFPFSQATDDDQDKMARNGFEAVNIEANPSDFAEEDIEFTEPTTIGSADFKSRSLRSVPSSETPQKYNAGMEAPSSETPQKYNAFSPNELRALDPDDMNPEDFSNIEDKRYINQDNR
eukprot:UN03709